jgi:hypothetical protein
MFIGVQLLGLTAWAQQPATSSNGNNGPYNVTSSFEVGVRGVEVNGNKEKYRSDLNYQPGVRLFDSSLLLRANEGTPGPFDTFLATSSGWGGDPTGYLRLNAEKSKWYEFNATVRKVDYYNSLSNLALNQHIADNEHKLGDFDVTLMPEARVKFNVGYSFDRLSGNSFTTYDYQRDEFPVALPVRSQTNDFRFGVDARVSVLDISFQQGLRYFKDDSTYVVSNPPGGFIPGNNPTNSSVIRDFHRDLPTRGTIPYSRLTLHTLLAKKVDITGRVIYTDAETEYELFETVTGRDSSGNNITLDRYSARGKVNRPNTIADLGVTVLATDRFRVSNTFRANMFRTNGAQRLLQDLFRTRTTPGGETPLAPVFLDELSFTLTNYRRFMNTIEGDYEFHPRFSGHFGHRYTDRRIENGQVVRATTATGELEPEEFDNRTNTFFWGFKARPISGWTLYFDMEHGEADNVFTRIDNYDFTNVRARSIIKPMDGLAINLSLITKDNTNPSMTEDVPPRNFGADVNSRVFVSSVDWTANPRFSLSSGYTRSHVTSEAVIIFFANSVRQQGLSRYFLRDNFAFVNAYVQIHPRASVYGSYRINVDKGQGDRLSAPTVIVGSYPQQFQTPEFRLAVKLHNRVDWNVGYQYYDFQERFINRQRYQAHMPYTSLRIYFNRGTD